MLKANGLLFEYHCICDSEFGMRCTSDCRMFNLLLDEARDSRKENKKPEFTILYHYESCFGSSDDASSVSEDGLHPTK